MDLLRRIPVLASLPVYLIGVLWRWTHIYTEHDPRAGIYSDMQVYIGAARRIAAEGYRLTPLDVTHPPATSWLFSQFYKSDPTFYSLVVLQFVVAALVPLAIGALAWVAFDQKAAAWSIAISSLYYYHVEYESYFLSEIYMMLLIPSIMALYLLAARATRVWRSVLLATLAGFLFLISIAFKTVAAPAVLGFAGLHWLLFKGATLRMKTVALVTLCLATLPGLAVISQRCTEANRGTFCLTSNKSAADFLLGHYDRIQSLKWTDSQFGSPAAQQHGYQQVPRVSFSITDSKQNFDTAVDWINGSPTKALVLSVQHVFDLFSPNAPWPTIWTPEWPLAQATMYLFMILLIWPTCLLLFDTFRSRGLVSMLRSTEFSVSSVLFGVMLAVFIATGESRYRLPFDCVFIVLGVQFYRRIFQRRGLTRQFRPLARPAAAQ